MLLSNLFPSSSQLLEVVFAYSHEFIFATFESSAQAHMHADTYLIITSTAAKSRALVLS